MQSSRLENKLAFYRSSWEQVSAWHTPRQRPLGQPVFAVDAAVALNFASQRAASHHRRQVAISHSKFTMSELSCRAISRPRPRPQLPLSTPLKPPSPKQGPRILAFDKCSIRKGRELHVCRKPGARAHFPLRLRKPPFQP